MNHIAPLSHPLPVECDKAILMPAVVSPAPPAEHLTADPEKVRAAEAIFAARDRESHAVEGVLALWTGTMLLNDIALDAFSKPAAEVERDLNEDKDTDR
jgi:hypothetical protein